MVILITASLSNKGKQGARKRRFHVSKDTIDIESLKNMC